MFIVKIGSKQRDKALGCVQTTDKKCWNGKVPMVIRSRDVIGPFSA